MSFFSAVDNDGHKQPILIHLHSFSFSFSFSIMWLTLTNDRRVLWYALVLFVLSYAAIVVVRPKCFYRQDGSLRTFGVGYQEKTILPLWLAAILLGFLAYLASHAWMRFFVRG